MSVPAATKTTARLALSLAALLALTTPAVLGQDAPQDAPQNVIEEAAPAGEGLNPVDITADNFVLDEASREAVFTGNVEVVHPAVTVYAPRVTIVYGEDGTSQIESFLAEGDVRLVSPGQVATGERAIFDPVANTLYLTGNVVVESESGTVRGPELLVDLETSISTFTGSSSGRVTGSFTTQ